MANHLIWDERYNLGVDIIDTEHEKLFRVINRLLSFIEEDDKSTWGCQEGIKYFKGHALKHFAEEEGYMESIHYPELETHKRLHKDFRFRILPALEHELETTHFSKESIQHFAGVCAGWLIAHTLTEDQAIVGKKLHKWGKLVPTEEQAAVIEVIIQVLKEMFRLDVRVVSECYGGEKFGKGIYYRLTYSEPGGGCQEVILVFEEKLLIDTAGKLIGDQSEKLDVMQMNAARYMARQFLECIRNHFTYIQSYELKSENLLTYEQFCKAFDRQPSKHSLLFSTKSGYFAFCVMASSVKLGKNVISIKPENAMAGIQEYLSKNEKENESNVGKKKLLLVDDSMTVRQAMKALLQKDYQVSLAESGVAAIRCLTLERPDLVLLDYEMPVCDGAQILQMIRSEVAFADVPVIFLTGRNDKESIDKIIPLKPAGYFLKSLKIAEIKKNIDDYFAKKEGGAQ